MDPKSELTFLKRTHKFCIHSVQNGFRRLNPTRKNVHPMLYRISQFPSLRTRLPPPRGLIPIPMVSSSASPLLLSLPSPNREPIQRTPSSLSAAATVAHTDRKPGLPSDDNGPHRDNPASASSPKPSGKMLIVADERRYVRYLEGITAPFRGKNQLHAAVVELCCHEVAEIIHGAQSLCWG